MAAMQMSQIIVPRLFESDNVYVFQNSDGRLIFASPFERDFTLIGTVTHDFTGDPAIVAMPGADVSYLCEAASRYFRERVAPTDVVRAVSGVNLTLASVRRTRRDDAVPRAPAQGAADHDVRRRRHHLAPARGAGGDEADAVLSDVAALDRRRRAARRRFCLGSFRHRGRPRARPLALSSEPQAQRLVAAYGSRLPAVLGEAKTRDELGPAFGPELTGAEVRYLMTHEWARFPEDILWRRSKLGLTMPAADRDALAAFMARCERSAPNRLSKGRSAASVRRHWGWQGP